MTIHTEWQPIARSRNVFLFAEPGNDPHRMARTVDLDSGKVSAEQHLQIWFKWVSWEVTDQSEYEKAKSEIDRKSS